MVFHRAKNKYHGKIDLKLCLGPKRKGLMGTATYCVHVMEIQVSNFLRELPYPRKIDNTNTLWSANAMNYNFITKRGYGHAHIIFAITC